MQPGAADEQAHIRAIAVNGEILFFRTILRLRIERGRIERKLPLGVEYLDRAEMLGRRGPIEQDQMADGFGDLLDLGQQHTAGDRAQRQIVELDVAADVGIDAGCQIVQRLAGKLLLATAHVEHDIGADRNKADHREHGAEDQKLCR